MSLLFTSNHDENSWSGSEFARLGDAVEVMAALTFLLPQNLPLIYTGQEYGYDHTFAFFDRDSMPDFDSNEYTEFYRRMCEIRHSCEALHSVDKGATFVEINTNAPDCLLCFVREVAGCRVVVEANLSPYTVFRDYHTGIYAGEYVDALQGAPATLYEHEWGDIAPWTYRILVCR